MAPLSIAAAVVCIVGAALALTFVLQARSHAAGASSASGAPLPSRSLVSADGSASVAPSASTSASSMLVDIEVPRVIGKPVKVAEALLTAAGFVVQTRIADVAVPGAAPESVTEQWPDAGALVQAGSQVVVTYEPRVAGSVDATYVVVIDAGHQAKADVALEPQGPGSKVRKPKVAGGATGVATREPEYARALKISLKLRDVLVSKGVKVVMVRTTNNVDIPNSERALIGNRANADLVVRVHLDSNSIASVNGISTLFPSGNTWVTAIEPRSHVAAAMIETAVVRGTGAASRGVVGRSDMSGFNYSTRPTVIVECGFMSNPAEDRLTAESAYQDKIAAGIAVGVMDFLQTK